MPCRSSRASISLRPRDSCERSRRPSGASGGAAGGGAGLARSRGVLAGGSCFGGLAGLAAAGVTGSGDAACAFAARAFLRSGFVCLATLSHSARSSSLRLRLRRGADNSGIGIEGGRFIGRGGDGDDDGSDGGAPHGSARCSAALPATGPALRPPPTSSQRGRRRAAGCVAAGIGLRCGLAVLGLILQGIDLRKQFCDFFRRPRVRHRHLAASRRGIEAVRDQDDEARIVPEPARHSSGLGAGAEIEIGARRTDDRRPRVLRDHQPPERRLRLLRFDRQLALDEERRAVDMQRLVDRDRAARRQRNALRAHRFILVGEVHLTKEHVGAVLPPQFIGAVGILLHPLPDLLHRHLILRDDVALDQDAADRRVGIAVMRVVIDADGGAVLEAAPAPSPGSA